MQSRGYLLRFIDIGLILLFGFLMISDLTVISQVALPGKSNQEQLEQADADLVYVGVGIDAEGVYAIEDLAVREPLYVNIGAVQELEFFLKTLKERHESEGRRLSVLIEPNPEAPMQGLVNVLDVCERLALVKHISTETIRTGVPS